MKKYIFIVLVLSLVFSQSIVIAGGTSINQLERSNEDLIGEVLSFKSTADKEPEREPSPKGYYFITEQTGSTTLEQCRFVRYLTSSWAKASSYTWQESQSSKWDYSGGLSYTFAKVARADLGITYSRTTTYSVAITIPANSSKFSKLAFGSDYEDTPVKVEEWAGAVYGGQVYNSLLETQYGTISEPQEDTYLYVKYHS